MMTNFPKIGDFARNIIHNYITFLYHRNALHFDALIIDTSTMTPWINDFVKEGIAREEVISELVVVEATIPLIEKAKLYLDKMNSTDIQLVDNLDYIEILSVLKEKEKELLNEGDKREV
jgi:hypothetical protein